MLYKNTAAFNIVVEAFVMGFKQFTECIRRKKHLEPVDSGTKFTMFSNIEPVGLYRLIKPLFARIVRRQNQADVEKLREILLSGGDPMVLTNIKIATWFAALAAPGDIVQVMIDSGLRGRGGAGFPTGRKWRIVRGYEGPRLMAVNGDEGEPGTFKDRYFLETDPCAFLEGTLIGAWAVQAEACERALSGPSYERAIAELERLRSRQGRKVPQQCLADLVCSPAEDPST